MRIAGSVLAAAIVTAASQPQPARVDISAGSAASIVENLRPGQFVWEPELAPEGPMLLVVNLRTQRALLYRNGVPIGAITISTGRTGHETPIGIFTILEKQIVHHSSKYDNAPMPYMERLTWQGVALHAGNLPGYPASHGCVRMPASFARLLYGSSSVGMTVVIANIAAAPHVAPTPDLLSPGAQTQELAEGVSWMPDKAPKGPVSVVISAADHRALVLRNGTIIGSAPVTVAAAVTGTYAYELRSVDKDGQHWVKLQLTADQASEQVSADEWRKFEAPEIFRKNIAAIVAPGMTIVVTAGSLSSAAAPATVLEAGH